MAVAAVTLCREWTLKMWFCASERRAQEWCLGFCAPPKYTHKSIQHQERNTLAQQTAIKVSEPYISFKFSCESSGYRVEKNISFMKDYFNTRLKLSENNIKNYINLKYIMC